MDKGFGGVKITAPTSVICHRPSNVDHSGVPILLIGYNRAEYSRRLLAAVREMHPSHLFVFVDGARSRGAEDQTQNEQVKAIFDHIDWDCEVSTMYPASNLGCARGVSSAIDWFFRHVDRGIILEDDCIPSRDFLPYCNELLEKFAEDARVMQICGFNHFPDQASKAVSYSFSKIGSIWGWATWRRAWQYYSLSLAEHDNVRDGIGACFHPFAAFANSRADAALHASRSLHTWDYQWEAVRCLQSGLSIVPSRNLISNIGFGHTATHTVGDPPDWLRPASSMTFPMTHPSNMVVDHRHDQRMMDLLTSELRDETYRWRSALGRIKRAILPGRPTEN